MPVNGIYPLPQGMDTPVIGKRGILNYTMTTWGGSEGKRTNAKDYAKEYKDELILNPSPIPNLSSQAIMMKEN